MAAQWHTGTMTKILKAGFAAGWIVLLAILLARIREFFSYWYVIGPIKGPWIFLSQVAESWFGYTVGVYLILWLVAKWWIKYVARG